MQTILITGVESVVGANLAAILAERHRVVGLTCLPQQGALSDQPLGIAGCEIDVCRSDDREQLRQYLATIAADWLIYCGPSARSSWDVTAPPARNADSLQQARRWAETAAEFGTRLAVISSDALFAGPWMFHDEGSSSQGKSPESQWIQALESTIHAACPDALIVRTNAFGWTPAWAEAGWVQRCLGELEAGRPLQANPRHYATPIVATALGHILQRALQSGLSGTFHITGAERINPVQFAVRLAEQFDLPGPCIEERHPDDDAPRETSLRATAIRRELGVGVPMLDDSLQALYDQHCLGYRDRLNCPAAAWEGEAA